MIYSANVDELMKAFDWIEKRHHEIAIEIPKLFDQMNSLNSVFHWRKIRAIKKQIDELMKESFDLVDEATHIHNRINSLAMDYVSDKLEEITKELNGDEG